MISFILAFLAIGPAALDGPPAPGVGAGPAQPSDLAPAEPYFLSLQPAGGHDGIRPYIRGGGIVTFPFSVDLGEDVKFDMGFGLQAAAGIEVGDNTRFRGELQYMFRRAGGTEVITFPTFDPVFVEADLTLHSLLINGQAVFHANGIASPYIGAGVGISHGVLEIEIDDESEDDSGTVPELQVMGGVLLKARDNLTLDLGVSYTYAFHELETSNGTDDAPVGVVSFTVGLTLRL